MFFILVFWNWPRLGRVQNTQRKKTRDYWNSLKKLQTPVLSPNHTPTLTHRHTLSSRLNLVHMFQKVSTSRGADPPKQNLWKQLEIIFQHCSSCHSNMCQSTEWNSKHWAKPHKITHWHNLLFIQQVTSEGRDASTALQCKEPSCQPTNSVKALSACTIFKVLVQFLINNENFHNFA